MPHVDNVENSNIIKKQCRVCHDYALVHFNFNGLSCQSCKKFFRRNALKEDNSKALKCSKGGGTCVIEKATRKQCKYCRLQRCFEIGMKKELILQNNNKNSSTTPPSSPSNSLKSSKQIIKSSTKKSNIDFIEKLKELHLLDYEKEKMREVQSAMSIFVDEYSLELVGAAKEDDFVKILNLAGLYAKTVINFCKNIAPFKCLRQGDQMKLLKTFYPRLSVLHAAFIYKPETDGFPIIVNENLDKVVFVKLDFYNNFTNKNSIPIFREYITRLHADLEDDVAIRDLVTAYLLFSPVDDVSCPEYMRYNSLIYRHLLARYMQEKHQESKNIKNVKPEEEMTVLAEAKYNQLMTTLNQIGPAVDIIREVYANDLNKNEVAHVLAEIYDLV